MQQVEKGSIAMGQRVCEEEECVSHQEPPAHRPNIATLDLHVITNGRTAPAPFGAPLRAVAFASSDLWVPQGIFQRCS